MFSYRNYSVPMNKAESKWSPQDSGIWTLTLSYLSVFFIFHNGYL